MTSHRESAYKEFSHISLPVSERLSDYSVVLPLFFPMDEVTVESIINTVTEILN